MIALYLQAIYCDVKIHTRFLDITSLPLLVMDSSLQSLTIFSDRSILASYDINVLVDSVNSQNRAGSRALSSVIDLGPAVRVM